MMNWLKGKKTYIGIVAWAVVASLENSGVLDTATAAWLKDAIIVWTGFSLRASITSKEVK